MTCIIGIETETHIYMGADSGYLAYVAEKCGNPKVALWNNGLMLVGCSGELRQMQVLLHNVTLANGFTELMKSMPPGEFPGSWERWIIGALLPLYRSQLRAIGTLDESVDGKQNAHIMLGTPGGLFTLHANWTLFKNRLHYEAIGAGGDVANGSLFTNQETMAENPVKAINTALRAGFEHSFAMREPFDIFRLDRQIRTAEQIQ